MVVTRQFSRVVRTMTVCNSTSARFGRSFPVIA